ncbi:MAG TPA: DUF3570 domain-containing protein [Gammaproteobacteria bacterium]|nr:DUF3570 domain-containing protein [Gammaproteobacteria bacterium]
MQLKDKAKPAVRQIGTPLAAATCTLLGLGATGSVVAQELPPWDLDTSLLIYSESDGRVRDTSVTARARKEIREEKFLDLTLAIDSLTGASPSGAVPASTVQTFTSPSGNSQYTVGAGAQALDTSFLDTRTALGASWEMPIARLSLLSLGASLSDEYDYTHAGLNARFARDFNNRNTTLSFGLALANDTIDPVGGTPVPLTPMLGVGAGSNKRGGQSKDVTDFLLGVTQVLSRHTIVQLNYSLSQSDGYLSDPYKVLSVVDPVTGSPTAGPAGSGLYRYLFDSRPDAREKQSLYGLVKRDFNGDVLEASYRYMTDDWGVDSHTLELRYRWSFGERYLQPHVRFYQQTAADFYRTVLFDGTPLPVYATADHRLGEFDGLTIGLKYGQATARGGEWSARVEYYTQTGNPSPGAAVGALAGFDLYPDLNAVIAQFSYKFGRR